MATKRVPDDQIPMEDVNKETKPAENSTPAVETTKEPETPEKNNDVKEEKKTWQRRIGEMLIANDDKKAQKKAEKKAKKEAKLQEKAANKAQKGESTGWSTTKKVVTAVGIGLTAAAAGFVAYEANKSNGVDYIDNGTPTTYIPEQSQTSVEEVRVESAAMDNSPSESAENFVETTSNE